MNSILPYHRGVLIQRGRGIGGVFNSLFRTLLPIGKSVMKSTPKLIKATAKSPLGKKLRKSAKKWLLTLFTPRYFTTYSHRSGPLRPPMKFEGEIIM